MLSRAAHIIFDCCLSSSASRQTVNGIFVRPVCRIDGMVKVRNLKKHMERFNEVVNGLKEGKQEMSKQVQELAAAVDALLAKIKVS